MNSCLKNFKFSQNSINTYKSCPLKFKYKYIDKINWKYDDIEHREYYESLKSGTDFHLLCERYFSNIPLGINENTNKDFIKWIEKVKSKVEIKKEHKYLTEYEVRLNLNGDTIQAKYDLIIIKEDSIEIWDWKTESRKLNNKNMENKLQTIVYMFLAKEVVTELMDKNISCDNITMNYYQTQFNDEPILIKYNNEKHKLNKDKITSYIKTIKNTKFTNNDKGCEYEVSRNKNHCKYCEFNKLCNGEEISNVDFEEEFYEC